MDPTVIHQPAASTREPYAADPPARMTANDQVLVGDIPAQRPGFQPRPALLAQLNRASQGPLAVVLTGTWGAGKTHLAAAYARARLAAGWRLIAWLNARDSESLLAGMAAVAEATGLSDGGSQRGLADAGRAVRHWLEADGNRCLLVFDDAEDLSLLQAIRSGHRRGPDTDHHGPGAGDGAGDRCPGRRVQRRGGTGLAGRADRPGRRSRRLGGGRRTWASSPGAGSGRGGDRRAAPGVRGVSGEAAGAVPGGLPGTGGGRGRRVVPAGRGGGGTAVPGGRLGCRPGRRVHRSHGGHGHAVAGGGPLRPAACRRAGGHTARRRAPGGRVHGGPGPGAAERTVTAGLQSGRPGRQRALPGGAGGPRKAGPAGAVRDGVPGGRSGPGNVWRGTREASGSGSGQGSARPGHGAAGKRGGARG